MPRHNIASDAGQTDGIVIYDETYERQDSEPAATDGARGLEDKVSDVPTDENGVAAAAQVLDKAIDAVIEPITDLASVTGANTDQAAAAGAPDWDFREQHTHDKAVQFANEFVESDQSQQLDMLNAQMQASGESLAIIGQRATEGFGNSDTAQLEGHNDDDRNEGFAAGFGHVMNQMSNFNTSVAGAIGRYHADASELLLATR